MRCLVVVVVALGVLPACAASPAHDGLSDGSGSGSDTGGASECTTDTECVPAAAACCDCPTFAVPAEDPSAIACGSVTCPMQTCAASVHAVCNAGACALACKPMTCDASCADGFALDASGCLTCACAAVDTRGCATAADCARVPADCCGCTAGGADTAVPASQVQSHIDMLACPPAPSCPGGDTCLPDLAPACVRGACTLVAGALPAAACGRSDLPACAPEQSCTVNASDPATMQGVGICL